MRWAFGLVALLIAAAIVLTMSARQTAHDFEVARRAVPSLKDDAAPRGFDEACGSSSRRASVQRSSTPPRSPSTSSARPP